MRLLSSFPGALAAKDALDGKCLLVPDGPTPLVSKGGVLLLYYTLTHPLVKGKFRDFQNP
jgi:hypothetical protein